MQAKNNLQHILPLVQRPGRYIGHEWNSHKKEKEPEVSVCLCFPDLYELGSSNLGIEILYHLVNASEHAVAERCFAPAGDLEAVLRTQKVPLFSLETHTPLREFDVVGFSLQYELCATNVLTMLDLAGLPLLAAERGDLFPLVIGGGPLTANPEPLADFFDAFVLGDGEEALQEILEKVRTFKQGGGAEKQKLLCALACIPGVYVPSLYTVAYHDNGTVASVSPVSPEVPARVSKRTVKLEETFFPHRQIVPYLQTVHNRLTVEIARGCPRKCRFCQATQYYYPWRVRSKDTVLKTVEEGLAATGYEEVSLASLSCTEYKELENVLQEMGRRYRSQRISISIPSLRCDRFSLKIAGDLSHNKRASLTFAPEAGTDRLRNVIGKELTEQGIRDTLLTAWRSGWKQVKLYFMVGLPTETDADIAGIPALVRSVRQEARGFNFNITLSPFVPKAQTPFQWVAMAHETVLRGRLRGLEKALPATVRSHYVDGSLLEGVFARGDRRLSRVVMSAWNKGCRFDQWKEHFKYRLWQDAFRDTGVDPDFYLYRERAKDEVLPWDHLLFGAGRDIFRREYEEALQVQAAVEEHAVEAEEKECIIPPPQAPTSFPLLKTVQRMRLRFARRGAVRFLSHLEQIEVFRRAIRRAGLPVLYTGGFHPQPKISFGPAVSVGYESTSEYIEIEFARRIEPAEISAKLSPELPPGYELLASRRIPLMFPSIDSLVNVALYEIGVEVTPEQREAFLARETMIVEKKKGGRVEQIDAKPLLRELLVTEGKVMLQLRFGPKRNVKPEKLVQLLCGITEDQAKLLPVCRTDFLIEKRDGTLTEP